MRYHALIAASAIAWATSAPAQQTTDCQPNGIGGVRCTTTGQPSGGGLNWGLLDPNAYQRGYDGALRGQQQMQQLIQQQQFANQQRAEARSRAQQTQAQADQIDSARALGVQAGQLVAAGDCPGAQKLALEAGDLELANSVKSYCGK